MLQHGQSASTTAADSSHSSVTVEWFKQWQPAPAVSQAPAPRGCMAACLTFVMVCAASPPQGVPIEELSEKINNQHW